MNRNIAVLVSAALAASVAIVSCSKTSSEERRAEEKPLVADAYFSVKQDKKVVVDCGQTVTFTISTNIDIDDWQCETSPEGLVQVKKDTSEFQLAVGDDLSMTEDRKIDVKFVCPRYPDLGFESYVTMKKALLLDVGFNADGSATDLSGNGIPITTYPGTNLVTYMNEDAGRYAARFFNIIGASITDCYYRIDFSSSTTLKNGISDGHSFECQFMLAEENTWDDEVKMFSATQSGGTGLTLTDPARGKDIAFIPNVSTTNTSNYCFAKSGVVPEVGKYYHVVGVWNKDEGKAYVYVNGELKGTKSANGSLVLPSSSNRWICVGGDVGPEGAEAAWNGDIVLARIYDAALSAGAVKKLWEAADKNFSEQGILISDVLYLPEGKVSVGCDMVVCGDGFKDGDRIVFKNMDGTDAYECSTVFGTDHLTYTIPDGFQSGTYLLYVVRGTSKSPLGKVSFTLSDKKTEWTAPGLIAHRGAWQEFGVPQNSIASLSKAQELGCFASETDLWITTDGVIYVNHDGVIGGKTIQKSTSAEMETVKLDNGEKIPTFREYLDQLKKSSVTKLSIELKDHSDQQREYLCADEAVRIVNEYGLMGQTEWNSFDWNTLGRVVSDDPSAVIYFQVTDPEKTSLQQMKDAGFSAGDYDYDYLCDHPELIEQAHEMGMFVVAGTVDSDTYYIRCAALGVDQISTNYPARFTEIASRLF